MKRDKERDELVEIELRRKKKGGKRGMRGKGKRDRKEERGGIKWGGTGT